jgi:hypothetical protein
MRTRQGPGSIGLVWTMMLASCSLADGSRPDTPPVVTAPVAQVARSMVRLDSAADLERLRETNPDHYSRARKILASANAICSQQQGTAHPIRIGGAVPVCGELWKTSLPPKVRLFFQLDDIDYIALVSVTANPGEALRIGQR